MKALKVFIAIILSAVMICFTAVALGSLALDQATCQKSIREALDKTNVLDTLMEEVLKENTVNMGGVYGTAATIIMRTDSMKQFIADYTTEALYAELHGQQRQEIANDELMVAFAAGIDEAAEESGFKLTPTENEMIRETMMTSIPILTSEISESIELYETTTIDEKTLQQISSIKLLANPLYRYGSIAVSLLILLILIILFWRSRMGFLWGGVNIIIASCGYGFLALLSGSFTNQSSVFVEPMKQMIYAMCEYGSIRIAIGGGIAGVVLIIICAIMRALRREY